jgi:hypothetical protein
MIIGFKKKPASSLYFSGLIAVCAFVGFAAVQVSSKLSGEPRVTTPTKSLVHAPIRISVHVIDGDTISLNDGRANVRLVGFNAPETGHRARCEAELRKGESAKRRLPASEVPGCEIGFEGRQVSNSLRLTPEKFPFFRDWRRRSVRTPIIGEAGAGWRYVSAQPDPSKRRTSARQQEWALHRSPMTLVR